MKGISSAARVAAGRIIQWLLPGEELREQDLEAVSAMVQEAIDKEVNLSKPRPIAGDDSAGLRQSAGQ